MGRRLASPHCFKKDVTHETTPACNDTAYCGRRAVLSLPAHAANTDTFCGPASGNTCETEPDAMIFLNKAKNTTSSTATIGPHGTIVFTLTSDTGSLNDLVDFSNGFATIKATKGQKDFNGIDFKAPTGYAFTQLSFDVQTFKNAKKDKTESFTVDGFSGAHVDDGIGGESDKPDADQEFSVTDTISPMDEVNIDSLTGFKEIKHFEIGGLCQVTANGCTPVIIPPPPVPEPAGIALLGVGLLGLAAVKWRSN